MSKPPPERRAIRATLHPAVRVGLYLPALAVGLIGAALLAGALLRFMRLELRLPARPAPGGGAADDVALGMQAAGLVAVLAVTYAFRRLLDRRSFTSLGLQLTPGWWEETLVGFGLGVVLMSLILAIELALGAYRFTGFGWQVLGMPELLAGLAAMFLVFVVVAAEEELVSRGYLLQNLAEAWGVLIAVLLSSALFAVAHLGNPGAGLISSLGIFVAGVQFAVGYLITGRLWLPIGLHLSWNFFQGPVFGFPVSGLDTAGLLLLEPVGPELLTGGEFGPEASLVGLAVDLLGLGLLALWGRRRRAAPDRAPLAAQRPN